MNINWMDILQRLDDKFRIRSWSPIHVRICEIQARTNHTATWSCLSIHRDNWCHSKVHYPRDDCIQMFPIVNQILARSTRRKVQGISHQICCCNRVDSWINSNSLASFLCTSKSTYFGRNFTNLEDLAQFLPIFKLIHHKLKLCLGACTRSEVWFHHRSHLAKNLAGIGRTRADHHAKFHNLRNLELFHHTIYRLVIVVNESNLSTVRTLLDNLLSYENHILNMLRFWSGSK